MFVHNRTRLPVCLKRMSMPEEPRPIDAFPFEPPPADARVIHFASATVAEAYAIEGERLVPIVANLPDALQPTFECGITNGTSVTASGVVEGASGGRLASRVRLGVGREAVELVCRGPRRWQRLSDGRFEATPPRPFEPFALDWALAYGGKVHVPAGVHPGSTLPHPAHDVPHMFNPEGTGYVMTADQADGVALPRVELLDQQVSSPADQPIPGGLTPYVGMGSMRRGNRLDARFQLGRDCHKSPFFPNHAAPFYLVFDELSPGLDLTLQGMKGGVLSLKIPAPRASVEWHAATPFKRGTRLRGVHIDADAARLFLIVQHMVIVSGKRLPREAVVKEQTS